MPGCIKYLRKKKLNDTVPNAFSFTPVTGATISTLYTSNQITLTGTNAPSNMTCSGGTVSINGGTYVGSGSVPPGATIRVRVTSASSYGAASNVATVTIGGVVSTFTVTVASAGPAILGGPFTSTGAASPNASISGNTLLPINSAKSYGVAPAIPNDGQWYYADTTFTGGTKGAAYGWYNGATLTIADRDSFFQATKIAMRWNSATSKFEAKLYLAGSTTAYETISSPLGMMYGYIGVYCAGNGQSITLNPYAGQWHLALPSDISYVALAQG